uniref:Uncharacterized protein n=1 Tax=Setaria viridis TaxID=4556 RepID=A0A4U6UUS9_SETVI|nr:hypothetical protein SEVIR_5G477450v2 [Setaria viridis]
MLMLLLITKSFFVSHWRHLEVNISHDNVDVYRRNLFCP